MRAPRDFVTTFNGLWASLLMASLNWTLDGIWSALNNLNWWPLEPVLYALENAINNFAGWAGNALFPGAGGAIDYLLAGPEGLATIARATGDTLVAHQNRMRYFQYTAIPNATIWANDYTDYRFGNVEWEIRFDVNNLDAYIADTYWRVENDLSWIARQIYQSIVDVAVSLQQHTDNLFHYTEWEIRYDVTNIINYLNQQVTNLNNRINAVQKQLSDAINSARAQCLAATAALGLFISTVEIPGALEAYTAINTAALAAATDILWPLLAEETDATAASILLTLPTVAARAADIPPELLPWLPGLGEGVVAALTFHGALHQSATAPLYNKLHQFADEIAGLPGIITTLIIGVLAAGAITAPQTTATVVADTLAGPLDTLLTGALGILGLGVK